MTWENGPKGDKLVREEKSFSSKEPSINDVTQFFDTDLDFYSDK